MRRFYCNFYCFLLVSILLTTLGVKWILTLYFKTTYQAWTLAYNQELSRGCFYLLDKELQGVAEADLPEKIKTLQVHFGYPIAVRKSAGLTLTPPEAAIYTQGKVVVRELGEGESSLLLRQTQGRDNALVMGPIVEFKPNARDNVVRLLTPIVLMTLCMLAWTWYFWRELSRISQAAGAFGGGLLSARVPISFLSPITAIAGVFNRMADQVEQLIASHKQLINAVSHELRTPISRIRFGLEQADSCDAAERTQALAGIRKDIDELEELVTELLDYAKLESSQPQVEHPPGPIVAWLEELASLARETLRVPLTFAHQGVASSCLVSYNPRLLERALHNLLQNADRFARTAITLTLAVTDTEVELTVADDGPGIPEQERERIFEPFVRLDASRNREFGGYGLGLAIVRQIARCHHGRIAVQSASSGGAAITLAWPRTPHLPCSPLPAEP